MIGLDIIRVFAMIGVLIYHYFFIGPAQGFYSKEVYFRQGYIGFWGVDIFFILSGFLILMSILKNGNVKRGGDFFKARMWRIYPTFFLCACITLVCGLVINPDKKGLVVSFLNSFVMYEDLYNMAPLSSIYWTLMIEVKFYVLVSIILLIIHFGKKSNHEKLFSKYIYLFLYSWILLSIANLYIWNNAILEKIFVTNYAAHFTAGILLFLMHRSRKAEQIPLVILCGWLIYDSMVGKVYYCQSFSDIQVNTIFVLFMTLLIIGSIYSLSQYEYNGRLTSIIVFLGKISFPFYLLHADLGFFIRTVLYHYGVVAILNLSETMIMIFAIVCDFVIASVITMVLDPLLRRGLSRLKQETAFGVGRKLIEKIK